jgi:hypothetical protein
MNRDDPADLALLDAGHECPQYGQAYYDHLMGDLGHLWDALEDPANLALKAVVTRILSKRKLEWGDLYSLEKCVYRLMPEAQLRRRVWALRDKYRVTFGEDQFRVYLDSRPPDPDSGKIELLRADVDQLLEQFHWKYAITPVRETVRNSVSRSIGIVMGVMLALILGLVLATNLMDLGQVRPRFASNLSRFTLFLTIMFMGAMGAFLSLQQRIQSIPSSGDAIVNVLAIHNGRFSIFLAPLSGAIFAVLAYLFFTGDLIQGAFFPDFRDHENKNVVIEQLFFNVEPGKGTELAKLLLWCFVVGFAERLIPDTLNRMIVRKVNDLADRLPTILGPTANPRPAVDDHDLSAPHAQAP